MEINCRTKQKEKRVRKWVKCEDKLWKRLGGPGKTTYNKRRCENDTLVEGDLVLMKHEPTATGTSRKLAEKYKGLYILIELLPGDRYLKPSNLSGFMKVWQPETR
ncbi:hypothetical protein Trydic_g22073 [Trypoxylus dichotomus]